MVRNTAMSYGVVQTKSSYTLKAAKDCFNKLWDESAHVAALCFVLAKQLTKRNPDEALLIGLMHGIGKLYILSKAEKQPELFTDGGLLMDIMDEWHVRIGNEILNTWGFETYVAAAIADYRNYQREHDGEPDYTDILTMASKFSMFMRAEDDMEFNLNEISASRRLNIGIADMIPIIEASNRQINSLHRALGM
ncbi:MAG: HDOD domain-containing protein [Proteobacteria bacterium]|nr:HDOD domain-containing protein [Pseudomonadota bacterium]